MNASHVTFKYKNVSIYRVPTYTNTKLNSEKLLEFEN